MSSTKENPIEVLNGIPENLPVVEVTAPEVEAVTPVDPMERPLWEIDPRVLDPFEELPPVMTWGHMGARPAIERQGIITISAKPKQGKSLAVYALLSSIISGEPLDNFAPDVLVPPRLAIVFDTEMNKPTLQRRLRGIYKGLGEQCRRFIVVPLLPVKKSERIKVIEEVTEKFQPDIVAMDVVTKLVNDFNSSDENSAFGDWLEKYAENRTVLVVIHQNKGKEDSNMKGHLGSILGEAAVENFSASMKDDVFTLSPVNARNSSAEGAPGVSFVLTEQGTFEGAGQRLEQQNEAEREKWREHFRLVFGDDDTLRHKELCARNAKVHGLQKRASETSVKIAAKFGAIEKVDPDDRLSPYRLT